MAKPEMTLRACVSIKHSRSGEHVGCVGRRAQLCMWWTFSVFKVGELNSEIKELTAALTKPGEAPLITQATKFQVRVFISVSHSLRSSSQERPGLCN